MPHRNRDHRASGLRCVLYIHFFPYNVTDARIVNTVSAWHAHAQGGLYPVNILLAKAGAITILPPTTTIKMVRW